MTKIKKRKKRLFYIYLSFFTPRNYYIAATRSEAFSHNTMLKTHRQTHTDNQQDNRNVVATVRLLKTKWVEMTQGNVASQFTTSTAALEPQHETSENVICSWISKPRTPNRRRRPLRRRETRICVYASGSLGVESRLKLATAADTLQRHADIYLPLNWPR